MLSSFHTIQNTPIEFERGQIVTLKSNPSDKGVITEIISGHPENRFNVFLNGSAQTFYASQLQAEQNIKKFKTIICDQFHAYLTTLQINYPNLSTLYSLNSARIEFISYQYRPVLRFIRSDRPRLLIADSVGVGKTIEAGLILRELQARQAIRSVLIICPRPLVAEKKWQNEMKRFAEDFTHLDGKSLKLCIEEMNLEGEWPIKYQKIIIPYSLFDETLLYGSKSHKKRQYIKGLLNLDPPPRFDLVIVDEAHHIRNENTFRHKAVNFFCDHAEAVVFLTATPIQLDNNDLFVLLKTLRPDLIIDQKSFAHMSEPNPFINQAISAMRSQYADWQTLALNALNQAKDTAWGKKMLIHNPNFDWICKALITDNISDEQRIKMISDTEEMHTFAGIINRTRRRDIDDLFAIRKPNTVNISFTSAQSYLHDQLLTIQTELFDRIHNNANVKFMMTTIRRQAASCLYGLKPFLNDILNRHLDVLSMEIEEDEVISESSIITIQDQVQDLLRISEQLDSEDPKLDALRNIIRDKQHMTNNKIILFSSFRHTLHYLFKHLDQDGFRIGLIHGGTPDEERIRLRERFQQSRKEKNTIDLLLFSEIGCEGLDYQFCDCIVNYDLPWNPMKIEQRIGRIDRKGQKSESITIINLITLGTIDADIYERCLMRIGVFNSSIGDCEEILGEITQKIKNIAENYHLNEEERQQKLQQLSDNTIRSIQEQEALEEKQAELFGLRVNQDIADVTNYWLSSASLQKLVILYLKQRCYKDQSFILGEKSLKTLRLSQEFRDILLKDFNKLPKQHSSIYRKWESWLKGTDQHLTITFESECANNEAEATFITPLHPLIKQAVDQMTGLFNSSPKIITHLQVSTKEIPEIPQIPAGQYEFIIYQWHFRGAKEGLSLKPLTSNPIVTTHFERLIQEAVDYPDASITTICHTIWDQLDQQHYQLWNDAKIAHQQHNQRLIEYRRESLSSSHSARITQLQEKLDHATNEKMQTMQKSQINNAERDYNERINTLNIALESTDIVATPVAYGVIHISEEYHYAKYD